MLRAGLYAKLFSNPNTFLCSSVINICPCLFSSAKCGKWDLISAVCIERKPVITKDLHSIEIQISNHFSELEYEKSLKSDHELRKEIDKKQAELLKRGDVLDVDIDQTMKQTAQDFEDASQDEFKKFEFAPRLCESVRESDKRSLERLLQQHLLLLVEQKLGNKYHWILPQGLRVEGETMREAAERALKESCGIHLKAEFLGNAPCGFYKYKYPKEIRDNPDEPVGAKVFFFKAWYVAGQVDCNKSLLKDFKWSSREELISSLHMNYYKSVSQFLVDE